MSQKIETTKSSVESQRTARGLGHEQAGNEFQLSSSNLVQRATHTPSRLAPPDVMRLQRAIGNQAVVRLLRDEAQVGPEGGSVGSDLATRIQSYQSGGKPIPDVVRKPVEAMTGSDLSGVRYHNDAGAHAINAQLGAKASTHQNRILLGKNQSPADVQLMAHELTHVVQQGGAAQRISTQRTSTQRKSQDKVSKAPKSHAMPLIQRKLDWQNTNWASARHVSTSKDGTGGALFVGEEGTREVVVKPGETFAEEAVMASLLINDTTKGKSDFLLAPGVRIVSPAEAKEMQATLTPLAEQEAAKFQDTDAQEDKDGESLPDRLKRLAGKITEPGTLVQEMATGTGYSKLTPTVKKHTEKKHLGGTLGSRKLRKESPLRIFKDRRSIEAMGKATTVDVFTGNRDRLLGFGGKMNRENFMVSPTTIRFIDNIQQTPSSNFKDILIPMGSNRPPRQITAKSALESWQNNPTAKALIGGDYNMIIDQVWGLVKTDAAREIREKDAKAFEKTMAPYKDRFYKYFAIGLKRGKIELIKSLDSILQNPKRMTDLMPGATQTDMQQYLDNMQARKQLLQGGL